MLSASGPIQKVGALSGADTGFFKRGGSICLRNAGMGEGGRGAVRCRPDTKSGEGGGAVRLRPDTKSGGEGRVLSGTSEKRGGGCLAEEGAVPYMKEGGVATPNPHPPPPPPPLDPPLPLFGTQQIRYR